jgi:hypothetical protein
VQTLATGVQPAGSTPRQRHAADRARHLGHRPDQLHRQGRRDAIDVAVAATDTLADVRDKINAAGAGVTALVMTDSSGSRLLIRSNATGAENAFRTTVTDGDGGNADATGLSMLAFDPRPAGADDAEPDASDAAATVNGLPVTSTSNTLTNIVDGLTLTLNAETTLTGPATVNVVTDTEALKKTLTDFAAAYSAVVKLIAADTKYDPVAKKGAILQGDSAATGMQRQLRTLAGSASAASAVFGHLSDIGLELQGDGSMTVNGTKLGAALANVAELKKMFSSSSRTDPDARRLRQALSRHRRLDDRHRRRDHHPHRRASASSCSATRRTRTRSSCASRRSRGATALSTPPSTRRWRSSRPRAPTSPSRSRPGAPTPSDPAGAARPCGA